MELHQTKQVLLLKKILRRKDEIREHLISNRTPITDIVYRDYTGWEPYNPAKKYAPIAVGQRSSSQSRPVGVVRSTRPSYRQGQRGACIWMVNRSRDSTSGTTRCR